VPILIGGTADAVIDRVVRWGAGWTAGGSAPDQVAPFAERVRAAWRDAGREGRPRIVALSYFSLGDEVVDASKAYLLDYYAYLGEWAQGIADGTPRSPEDVRTTASRFEEAGVDELIFDPTVADLEQVDRLADVML
jgi:alkanesulfonate monooxygenase SsuD/methylene tetrahydromethanopterin reductase-like flavin-dependent oxidoreductase (luciferase family)